MAECDYCGEAIQDSDLTARCGGCVRQHCSVHMDSQHGKEAEELRKGIETLIAGCSEDDGVPAHELQRLLDRIDACDSLAHLEREAP